MNKWLKNIQFVSLIIIPIACSVALAADLFGHPLTSVPWWVVAGAGMGAMSFIEGND